MLLNCKSLFTPKYVRNLMTYLHIELKNYDINKTDASIPLTHLLTIILLLLSSVWFSIFIIDINIIRPSDLNNLDVNYLSEVTLPLPWRIPMTTLYIT